ncbi:hypothetical protein H8E88_14430 [candidate division KSB1 bacterium]|nr:hypothetical protein [candidate division KSB1 bacterium]MBL7094817.1 hypothetical protein [candidate division KSB1 bacterium]
MRKIILFILMGIFIVSFGNETIAQKSRPSNELLADIEIMETVLDKLIKPSPRHIYFFGSNSKGFYLLDYGVIFNIHYTLSNQDVIELKFDELLKSRRNNTYVVKNEKKQDEEAGFEKEIEQLKKSLLRFLGSYVSSIRDLKLDESVSIIVDFNGFVGSFRRSLAEAPRQLIASVKMADLKKHRQGKISDENFRKKINFSTIESFDEDISIFGNVIKTSLEHPGDSRRFGLAGDVKGIHFKGYGVLFITNVDWGISGVKQFFLDDNNKGSFSFSISSNDNEKIIKETEEDLKKLERKLIRAVSNYGHTLRGLQPNEWIELAVNFKGGVGKDNFTKSIIKVKKKIIDDFHRDKISFDQFKDAVQIIYY